MSCWTLKIGGRGQGGLNELLDFMGGWVGGWVGGWETLPTHQVAEGSIDKTSYGISQVLCDLLGEVTQASS